MRRNFYDAVFFQEGVIGEHAVDAAAKRARMHIGRRLAALPALKEITGDAIAGLEAADAGPDLDHLAGAIRQRDDVVPHRHAVRAANNAEVAEIKRASLDLDQDLTMARLGIGTLDRRERLDTGAAFG